MILKSNSAFPGILTAGKTYAAEKQTATSYRITDDSGKSIIVDEQHFERPSFERGDQLLCKKRRAYQKSLTVGNTYTAISDEENGALRLVNDDGEDGSYDAEQFDLQSRAPVGFKEGDVLVCIDAKDYVGIRQNRIYEAIADQNGDSIQIRNEQGQACDYEVDCFKLSSPVFNVGLPTDPVNRPAHYTDGKIEVIDFIEDKKLGYHLGNAIKYIARAGKKDPAKTAEDLEKAIWYIKRHIQCVTAQ